MSPTADEVRKKKIHILYIYAIAILLGLLSGLSNIEFLQNIGLVISDVFIKIFKCISLPIIALSLIVALSQHGVQGSMHKIWQRTLLYTISTTIIAATVACVLYLLISPPNISTPDPGQAGTANIAHGGYFSHLANIIPSNFFAPFVEHQVMGVLLISIVVGLAIRCIQDTAAHEAISGFFKGAHALFIVITGWVVKAIPVALFGFVTAATIEMQSGANFGGLGEYLLVIVLANLVQAFIILPAWLKMNGVKPFEAMRGMSPALSVAFFSKSSAGTLPVTMASAEKNLGIQPRISRFVLPLCTTINMNGCAAFIFATVIFLMQNHGVEITFSLMLLWIVIATIASVGNAGVPMGCFFLSASLLASMDVPIVLLGLILPFYTLIDMVETALNVWSDSCVAKIVDTKVPQLPQGT